MSYSTAQDLLTLLAIATFIFSALNFGLSFCSFVASHSSPRLRRYVPSVQPVAQPTPTMIASPVPQLPSITPVQADQNLDHQLSHLSATDALAPNCRSYTASLSTTAQSAAKTRSKPSTALIPLSVPPAASASPKRFLLRKEEVIIVADLPFQLPSDFKTFLLRGKSVAKVLDLKAAGLLS